MVLQKKRKPQLQIQLEEPGSGGIFCRKCDKRNPKSKSDNKISSGDCGIGNWFCSLFCNGKEKV